MGAHAKRGALEQEVPFETVDTGVLAELACLQRRLMGAALQARTLGHASAGVFGDLAEPVRQAWSLSLDAIALLNLRTPQLPHALA